jgi:hypothetical protein
MTLEEFAKQYNIGYEKESTQDDNASPKQQQLQEPTATSSSLQDFAKQFNLPYAEEKPTQDLLATEPSAFDLEMGLATPEPAPKPAAIPSVETPTQSISDIEFSSYGVFEPDVAIEKEDEFVIPHQDLSKNKHYSMVLKITWKQDMAK